MGRAKRPAGRPAHTTVKTLRRQLRDDANNPTYIFTEPWGGYWMANRETLGPEES